MVWNPKSALFGGRYIVERKLGEGGIGITYLARNEWGELRVIKTLKEEILNNPIWKPHQNKLKQDFRDEAMRLVVCRHRHIVKIENIFEEGSLPCIVMEYIEGEDLSDRLQRMRLLSEAEALLYIRQIGDALTVIHRQGLLHRDIKPRNIMIRAGKSEAVLIDFGIAREFLPNVVQKHTVYRTPGFAPPEQYEFVAPRGEYIDVYALAATLYNLLTGVIPTSAEKRRQNVPLQPLEYYNANVSASVKQAIMQGMELQPSRRPQSVQQWLDLLTAEDDEPTIILRLPQLETGHNWQCVHTLQGHSSMVQAIAISPDGVTLASGSNDNTIKLWQLSTGKLLRTFGRWFSGHGSMVHSVAFSPNGEQIVSGSWDRTIKLWQVSTGKLIRTFTGHSHWVNSVAFNPNPPGGFFASGSADGTIKLWEVDTGREIRTFIGHSDSVWSVAFSFDGSILASGSADCTIKLWQLSTGNNIRTFTKHSFFVNSVTISRDGEILASGSSDNTIKLWSINTGREIHTLRGHSNSVWSVAFSPNGELLASGSWDKTIKIWHVSTGREICTMSDHANYIRAIAWSPDGQTLVSGSDDDTIKIWRQQ
ncbi:serine/threonine-protein kinase [Iningainema tapete]|uniref:Serine/threonine protein kinase n=1 Tax=Iningainema tapete BLCC-T55 TaxID=2748662 RepID=A0A8J6XI07_9CYAN|nr:serine/threonine-protein kinase [Iningainema tapete]MBD2772676.1 serine/threonine protein kinase [Iningainema tapete BLCC-T55]